MAFAVAAKNEMLDGLTVDRVRLHSGLPGAAGTDNQIASTYVAATFAAAAASARALSAQIDYTGLTANQAITYFSVWEDNAGTPIFKGSGQITTGDVAANAAGQYSLTTSTQLTLSDPA